MISDPCMANDRARSPLSRRHGALRRLTLLTPCLLCLLGSSASAQISKGPPRIRNLYIPADQLQVLFDKKSKGVLMPREKILALWREGQRRGEPQTSLPVDTVLTQAEYETQLDEHALRITGRIRIAKLRAGWQAIDLPFGGLAIESAQVDGWPARFGRKDNGTLFLVLQNAGRFELQLEMSAPLASKGGDLAATLKLPPVPASEVLLRLDEGKRVRLGETALLPDSTKNGRQLFRIAVDHTGLVPLVVSDRFGGGNRTPLVFADSRLTGRVEPAGLRLDFSISLNVYARAQETFTLQLPDSVNVAEVEAPQLGAWTIQKQPDGTATVTLTFRKPVLGRRTVRLLALAPFPADTQWNLPNVKLLDCMSHVGQVFLYSAPSLRVEVGALAGIRSEPLSPDSTDAKALTDTPLTFVFWDKNFDLPVRVIPRRLRLQASVATLVEIDRAGLALRSSVTIEPRHAPVFDVEILLPPDWQVRSVLAAGQAVDWESVASKATGAAGNARLQTIRFDLVKPLRPGESLEIELNAQRHPKGWLERDDAFSELPLPEVRVAAADELEGTLLIQAPPDIELRVADLSNGLQPVAADRSRTDSAQPQGTQSQGTQPEGTALQYSYQDDARVSGRLRVRPKPAKVSAETLSFVRPDRGKLDVHYQLDLHIRQGRIRRIGFTLPAAVGKKIRIAPSGSPARIIEQRHASLAPDGEAGAELTLWQIVLDRPVTGDLTLELDFEQTFSARASGGQSESSSGEPVATKAGRPVDVPVLAVRNVSRQSGIVALEAAGDQQLDYEAENLRNLDPADVPQPRDYAPSRRIVAAYQYSRLPYRLTISTTRHQSEPVLTAICGSASITTIAAGEGRMRHQARFWIRSANLQQLPVVLPENANLWTVMIDGEPIEVRREQGTYIVPLPARQVELANEARELSLLYETENPPPAADGLPGRCRPRTIRQRAPEIAMTTLETLWEVHPPEGMEIVSTGGDFRPATRFTPPGLVTHLAATIARQSTTALPWKVGGLVAAVVFAGFFMLLSSGKKPGSRLVEVLVVITILGILVALLLPATQSAREASRRCSCTNQLKQLGLALHNYASVHGQFPPAAIGPAGVPRYRQFSWIVAILPYLEQNSLYESLRLDLPCDNPHNAALLRVPFRVVLCPSDPAPTMTSSGASKTSYVAVTGADWTSGLGKIRGVIGFDRGLAIDEIVDGPNQTVMVAEVIDGGPWYAGGDGTARPIDYWIRSETWSHHPGVANFLFADDSVQSMESTTDHQTLRGLATAQGLDRLAESDDGYETAATSKSDVPADAPVEEAAPGEPEPVEKKEAEDLDLAMPSSKLDDGPDDGSEDGPSSGVAPRPPIQEGERARLSLRIALEADQGEPIRFRREGGSGELVLRLRDRSGASTLRWLVVAATLLAAWVWRRASRSRRDVACILGLALPIGLSGLVPPVSVPLLDGLLLGTLAAAGLWVLLWCIAEMKTPAAACPAAAIAIVAGLLFAAHTAVAGETPAATDTKASTAKGRESNLTLFIPYDPEDGKPLESKQVYLPHDEFLRLWKKAHPEEPDRSPSGVGAIVSHAEYTGRVDGDVARFDGRLLIHHFDDRWTRVVLPLGKVAFEKIEINGQPANLVDGAPAVVQSTRKEKPAAAAGEPAIYLEDPGAHVVDLRFSVPVSRLGVTGQMTLPLRAVPSGRLRLELPGNDLDVQVGGCSGGWRRNGRSAKPGSPAKNVRESVSIPLGAGGEVSIRWQPRRVEAHEGQLIGVDQSILITVLDTGVHLHGKLHYRIEQGAISKLQLRLPPDLAIRQVHGAEVADWSIETDPADGPNPARQRLVVSLKTERTTATEIEIHAFRRDRRMTGTIDIDAPRPLGVARETGRIAIGCSSHFRVRVRETAGIDQVNRTGLDLPRKSSDAWSVLAAYRYTSRPWRLQLEVERKSPRVEVSERTAVAVTSRQTSLRSLLTAHVTGAPVTSFSLRLPASLRVSRVRVPPGAEWFVDGNDEGRRLKVELDKPTIGKMELAISGTLVRESDDAEFVVPCISVEEAQVHRGQLAIHLDDDLEAVLASDGGARSIDPAALDRVLRADGSPPVRYAFKFDSPPKGLRLRLSPAPSRASADVTTVVSVREGSVAYISQVDFEIHQAGRSRFRVLTPDWLGEDVKVQGNHIRLVRSEAGAGGRTWEIELQQPVRGSYRLHLIQTLPLADDGTVPAAVIRPLDVERSRNHVVLENLTSDEIAPATTTGAMPVPIGAVPEGLADDTRRQAVAAYRITRRKATLVWQRRVRQQESGLAATIILADLTTVVLADGQYRVRAVYNIRNLSLQFLEVGLPPKSRVWSVHVSGQPVRPAKIRRQGRPVTLLPLQKTSAGDFSSKVVLVFSGQLDEPLGRWSRFRPPAPRILSDIPVSRTLWTVLLPPEYKASLVQGESNLQQVVAAYQQEERKLSFLDELRPMLQVASQKGKSGAREKARYKLEQAGLELEHYAREQSEVEAGNATDVQEQAKRLEAEVRRLKELKPDVRRADDDASSYFIEPQPKGRKADVDLNLSELKMRDAEETVAEDSAKKPEAEFRTRPGQRRGDLRKQADEQLAKLQAMPREDRAGQKPVAPQERDTTALPPAVDTPLQELSQAGHTTPDAVGAGLLSLNFEFPRVGTAYHFRKLHGEPRLVLRARHEDVGRSLTAIVWAGLCLALAVPVIQAIRRPNAAALARRYWPWLAAVAGTIWLFLLPAGILGLILLATTLCVLTSRARSPR